MNRDWLFVGENEVCHFRSAGILLQNNKILLQRDKEGNEYATPGGHVIIGETGEQSLIREYKEETGADVVVQRLIWIEENFWKWGQKMPTTFAFITLFHL